MVSAINSRAPDLQAAGAAHSYANANGSSGCSRLLALICRFASIASVGHPIRALRQNYFRQPKLSTNENVSMIRQKSKHIDEKLSKLLISLK